MTAGVPDLRPLLREARGDGERVDRRRFLRPRPNVPRAPGEKQHLSFRALLPPFRPKADALMIKHVLSVNLAADVCDTCG